MGRIWPLAAPFSLRQACASAARKGLPKTHSQLLPDICTALWLEIPATAARQHCLQAAVAMVVQMHPLRSLRGSFILHRVLDECGSSTPVLAGSSAAASLATGRHCPCCRFSWGCSWQGHRDKRCHLLQVLTAAGRRVHGTRTGCRAWSEDPIASPVLTSAPS